MSSPVRPYVVLVFSSVVLLDTSLKIKYTLPTTSGQYKSEIIMKRLLQSVFIKSNLIHDLLP